MENKIGGEILEKIYSSINRKNIQKYLKNNSIITKVTSREKIVNIPELQENHDYKLICILLLLNENNNMPILDEKNRIIKNKLILIKKALGIELINVFKTLNLIKEEKTKFNKNITIYIKSTQKEFNLTIESSMPRLHGKINKNIKNKI